MLALRPPIIDVPTDDATRRQFLGIIAAAGLLAACGSEEMPDSSGSSSQPRTIEHEGGKLTLDQRPKRVLAAGPYSELDALLVLGIEPVGIGAEGGKVKPYQVEAGAKDIPSYDSMDGPNLEEVAALRPDLVVINADTYAQLPDWISAYERICPVVGLPIELESQLDLVAQIFDVDDETLDGAKQKIDDAVAAFKPKTRPESVAIVNYYTEDGFYVWTEKSGYAALFRRLGLAIPTGPKGVEVETHDAPMALERIEELDRDLLIVFEGVEGKDPAIDELEARQLFQNLSVVKEGRYARLNVEESIWLGDATALTIDDAVATLNRVLG